MDRETATDVLVGALLIGVLVVPGLAAVGIVWCVAHAANLIFKHFWPAVIIPSNAILDGIVCLGLLVMVIGQIRKRLWTNLFLSGATALAFALSWWRNPGFPYTGLLTDNALVFVWLLIVFAVPQKVSISRGRFFAVATLIGILVAIRTGLLGSGGLAHIAALVDQVGMFLCFLYIVREDPRFMGSISEELSLKSS